MKEGKNKSRKPVFIPYGLKIAKEEIFNSAGNLGIAITGALTGTPPDDVKINSANISIGLGCFSVIGVSISEEYEGPESLDFCNFDDCSIMSCIRYSPNLDPKNLWWSKKFEDPILLNFNVIPSVLLERNISGVQILGPKRILSHVKTEEMDINIEDGLSMIDLDNYLEGGVEPSNAMLTPSAEELDLIMEEKDSNKRFGMLMNMITSFASTVSAKLMHSGLVQPAAILMYSEEAREGLMEFARKRIDKPWRPTKKMVEDGMKRFNLKMSDLHPSVRKLFWPKKRLKS